MTNFVLLTDRDNNTCLVATDDGFEVGEAAIWSGGSVSAWEMPERAVDATDPATQAKVVDTLREGGNCADLLNLRLPTVPTWPEPRPAREHILVIEGAALDHLREAINPQKLGLYKVSIVDDGGIKIKVNEFMWTPILAPNGS